MRWVPSKIVKLEKAINSIANINLEDGTDIASITGGLGRMGTSGLACGIGKSYSSELHVLHHGWNIHNRWHWFWWTFRLKWTMFAIVVVGYDILTRTRTDEQ